MLICLCIHCLLDMGICSTLEMSGKQPRPAVSQECDAIGWSLKDTTCLAYGASLGKVNGNIGYQDAERVLSNEAHASA